MTGERQGPDHSDLRPSYKTELVDSGKQLNSSYVKGVEWSDLCFWKITLTGSSIQADQGKSRQHLLWGQQ